MDLGNLSKVHPVSVTMNHRKPADANTATPEIVVYWRPGCGFCSSLRSELDRRGVPHRLMNIWDTPAAIERVRAITGGNETVPTVEVGPVSLVNPGVDEVLAAALVHAPDAVPDGFEPPQMGRVGRIMTRILGGAS